MSTFIQNLLMVNAGIAAVMAVFILLRRFLKSKVHIQVICMLWTVIFLRMLVPVPIESSIGVMRKDIVADMYTSAESFAGSRTSTAADNTPANSDAGIAAESTESQSIKIMPMAENALDAAETAIEKPRMGKATIALIIYLLGMAAAFGYVLASNIKFEKIIRRSCTELQLTDGDAEIFARQKIKQQKVYLAKHLHSPCLAGVIRPKILLNEKSISDDKTRRYSLYHETTHYKYKDNIIFTIALGASIINWFNPLMWVALSLMKKDRELLCDERVIRLIGQEQMIDYGKSLLYLAHNNGNTLLNIPTTMTGGKKEMKERIKNLAGNKKRWIIASVLLALVIAVLIVVIGTARLPKIPERSVNGLQTLYYDHPLFEGYEKFFDKVRDTDDTHLVLLHRKDVDKDGIDELYSVSVMVNGDESEQIIEFYDIETGTYQKIVSDDEWQYRLITYGDKIYIYATKKAGFAIDDIFHIYLPHFENGQLSYEEIDEKLEAKIIDYFAEHIMMSISIDGESVIIISFDNIIDITITDRRTPQEEMIFNVGNGDTESMKKIVLLMTNENSTSIDDEIDHRYRAVIKAEYEGEIEYLTYLFGDSEYVTIYIGEEKSVVRNDGLRNFLLTLVGEEVAVVES